MTQKYIIRLIDHFGGQIVKRKKVVFDKHVPEISPFLKVVSFLATSVVEKEDRTEVIFDRRIRKIKVPSLVKLPVKAYDVSEVVKWLLSNKKHLFYYYVHSTLYEDTIYVVDLLSPQEYISISLTSSYVTVKSYVKDIDAKTLEALYVKVPKG